MSLPSPPPACNPSACRASGRGLQPKGVRVKEVADFRVHSRGAGSGELSISVKGPSKTLPTWCPSALPCPPPPPHSCPPPSRPSSTSPSASPSSTPFSSSSPLSPPCPPDLPTSPPPPHCPRPPTFSVFSFICFSSSFAFSLSSSLSFFFFCCRGSGGARQGAGDGQWHLRV